MELVKSSYSISNDFQIKHSTLVGKIEAIVSEYTTLKAELSSYDIKPSSDILTLDIKKEVRSEILTTSRGKKVNGYLITERGYLILLQQLRTPKLPKTQLLLSMARLKVINSTLMMVDIIKNKI